MCYRLIGAISRLLSKYPTNQQVFQDSCNAVVALKSSLPLEITDTLTQLHDSALVAISQLELRQESMAVIDSALNLIILLWSRYPKQLPAACNMAHLSTLLNAALDVGTHGEKAAAVQVGQDMVGCLMRLLSDKQLGELEEHGVGRKLRSLLSHYEVIPADTLKQIVVGVGMLAEVKFNKPEFVEDNLHTFLLFAAQKHFSNNAIQQLIWRLLCIIVQQDVSFVRDLLACGVLPAVTAIMQNEGYKLMPLIRVLTVCCHKVPDPFLERLLESRELLSALLQVADPDSKHPLESVTNTCDFLAYLCGKLPFSHMGHMVDLGVVVQIEACARKWPDACLLPACLAIEGLCTPYPKEMLSKDTQQKREQFFDQDHHLFVKDMLCDPVVAQSGTLIELIYVLFQKLLRASPPATLSRMGEKEFIEFLVMVFARDTSTFPQQANRIAFTMHYFVFQMKSHKCFEHLRDFCFHTFIIDLIATSDSYDVTATALGLLASLLGKYYDYFGNIEMVLETQLPDLLVSKCSQYGHQPMTQFGDDFCRILLNLTAKKEMSLELHKHGYMDKLLGLMRGGSKYTPVIRRSIIHAMGNISLGNQSIKQELYDKEFYEILLSTLERELERGDALLLSACCRVLHILASGDWAKRKFVERGCVPLLLRLLKIRCQGSKSGSEEVSWRALGLLSSIGFMAVSNRRYVLTAEVIDTIADILLNTKNGKIVSYTVLIFLGAGELDEGAVHVRQLEIEEHLTKAMKDVTYKKQAPDLERWGDHVLEKQYLFTLQTPPGASNIPTLPPPLSTSSARQIDWPHRLTALESSMESDAKEGGGRGLCRLLPLQEAYLVPQHPVAPDLSPAAKHQLRALGLDPEQPLFRIGRMYGSTHGFCSNCEKEGASEELVIRTHSITPHQYQELIDYGWYRRGGVKMFRLRCNHNAYHADWETRVNALQFDRRSHKSYGRVLKRMPKDRLTVETLPTHFNRDAFDLYNDYHVVKHEKPLKSMFSYCEHVVNSPIQPQTIDGIDYGTFHQLYRLDGKLVAIGIIDVVPKGVVSIYMWYDLTKSVAKFSFGVYSALKEIELACDYHKRNPNMRHYYMQGWSALNKKLAYKSNYTPGSFYCPTVVDDWVEGEEGVKRCQDDYVQRKKEEEMKEEGKMEEGGQGGGVEAKGGGESIPQDQDESKNEGGTKSSDSQAAKSSAANSCNTHEENGQEDMDTTDGGEAEQKQQETANDKEEEEAGEKSDSPAFACEAYPHDLARYTARTGESTVNICSIVACLNYTEYMRLGDVLERYRVPEAQRKVLEQRLSELVVALSPHLLSQLVIDFKVCTRQGGKFSAIIDETSSVD